MPLIQRVSYSEVPWGWLALTIALTGMGVSFVISACYDPGAAYGLGDEARKQLAWWGVSLIVCLMAMHVPFALWRGLAVPLFFAGLGLELFMLVAAGTSVVPMIKGQANWLVLGPLRLQPVEFIKLATLLACARLVSSPDFQPARLLHMAAALGLAAFPSLLLARSDLGSALTFPPMIFGMLLAMGMRLLHVAIIGIACVVLAVGSITVLTMDAKEGSSIRKVQESLLPRTGPKSYQYKRIMAWLNPDDYALTEGYQTARSVRSIGSGQFMGKGYLEGDQNRLGWLPEKHTDLIFAVVGEEVGFLGSVLVLALFLGFAWGGLHAAAMCRDPCGRALIIGYVCLIVGQCAINLAVATGMMPVTGVTLPFFSYGGSSLLASHLGLGICLSAALAPRREQTRMGLG
ncbi:MAG TPA: FtsW/RodA/SpoVE family cell cycle protein [Planctomycetota bacterium]|nr:FtsW/RodA/SpoVE family cell cycle protein [Planctomycetota bacterium]